MNKRKIMVMAMALCMAAILVVGGTLAYFTDTDSAKNVFTTGNVEIDLTEATVKEDADGNLVKDGEKREDVGAEEKDEYDYGNVYPGQYVEKDPTIENLGSEDIYMAAVVTIKSSGDLFSVIGSTYEGSTYLDVTTAVELENGAESVQVVDGGLAAQQSTWVADWHGNDTFVCETGEKCHIVQKVVKQYNAEDEEPGCEYVMYFFVDEPQQTGDKVTLFEKLNFDWEWDNAEMAAFKNMSINVDAYAVQAHGFTNTAAGDDCYEAITAAFPTEFAAVMP